MHVLICANGAPQTLPRTIPVGDYIIAADGGARLCRRARLRPNLLIGDLDSLTSAEIAELRAEGVEVRQYPAQKDQTDLELALEAAVEVGAERVTILGALGGRWDQSLANLMLLAHPRWRSLPVVLLAGEERVLLIAERARLCGEVGDTVSLIPLGGDARGVTTSGLAYPLTDGVLPFGATLGVSNVLSAPCAEITVRSGLVLAFHTPKAQLAEIEEAKKREALGR